MHIDDFNFVQDVPLQRVVMMFGSENLHLVALFDRGRFSEKIIPIRSDWWNQLSEIKTDNDIEQFFGIAPQLACYDFFENKQIWIDAIKRRIHSNLFNRNELALFIKKIRKLDHHPLDGVNDDEWLDNNLPAALHFYRGLIKSIFCSTTRKCIRNPFYDAWLNNMDVICNERPLAYYFDFAAMPLNVQNFFVLRDTKFIYQKVGWLVPPYHN